MDRDKQLRSIAVRQKKQDRTEHLGQVLNEFMEKQLLPQQKSSAAIADLWDQLLPVEMAGHCRPDSFSGGLLKVIVDSPVYMHELRLCCSELLGQLQKQCPRARIRTIKLVLG